MSAVKSSTKIPSMLTTLMIVFLIRQASSDVYKPFRQHESLGSRDMLLLEQLEFFFHMLAAHLCVSDSGLNGWHPAFSNMPEIIGHLFQAPACGPRPVCKVVTQSVKIDIVESISELKSLLTIRHLYGWN